MGPTWAKIPIWDPHGSNFWASCPDSAHMGPICQCVLGSAFLFDWIFFFLASNKDSYIVSNELKIDRIQPWTAELAALD